MKRLRRSLLPVAVLLAASAVVVPAARSKERGGKVAKAAPVKAPADAPLTSPAYLRLWKTDLPGTPSLRLTWNLAGEHPDKPGRDAGKAMGSAPEIARAGAGYQFGDYFEVPAGHGALAADADGRALTNLPAELAPGSHSTLLVTARGAELIADDPAAAAGTGDFTLRNLTPGLNSLRVTIGEGLTARFESPDGLLRMRGLKAAVHQILTEGIDATGKPFSWTSEVDLVHFPRQTLLVYPDAYGRIRPRLSVDGAAPATEATPGKG